MNKVNEQLKLKHGEVLKNRLVMAPMTTQFSTSGGIITDYEIDYYRNRSKDVAAVITGAANVQRIGQGWSEELAVYDDKYLEGLSNLASAIKEEGAQAILQIFHGGRMSPSSILDGEQAVSASAIKAERPNAETPRELSEEEIIELIEDFKNASIRAVKAGFDGIEIHGANTYLIQQFFSPHSNRRNDKWGGSLENRYHFIDVLVDGIIKSARNINKDFIIGYRFSPEEFEEPGIKFEDTIYLVDKLCTKDLDYLHISLRAYDYISQNNSFNEKSILNYIHNEIDGRIPLIGVGNVENGNDVEGVLENAELVAVGRALIYDPRWGYKILNNEEVTEVSKLPDGVGLREFGNKTLSQFVIDLRTDK